MAATGFRRAIVADLPGGYTHESSGSALLASSREASPGIAENPNGDLSIKRNLGLLLARMLGWERIFFMDDDIRDVHARRICTPRSPCSAATVRRE